MAGYSRPTSGPSSLEGLAESYPGRGRPWTPRSPIRWTRTPATPGSSRCSPQGPGRPPLPACRSDLPPAPVLDSRCDSRRRVSNASTGSAPRGTERRPSQLIPIIRGTSRGVPAGPPARGLGCDRSGLHESRHRLRDQAHRNRDDEPPGDEAVEADEAYRDAGEGRRPARRSRGPAATPGRRAAGPRHPGGRPAADLRGRRPPQWSGPADGGHRLRRRDLAEGGEEGHRARGDGLHRRVAGIRPPAVDPARARDGLPCRAGVGPRR